VIDLNKIFNDHLNKDTYIYNIGGGWGDAIRFTDESYKEVVGWKSRRPKAGDVLLVPMQSGKTGRFKFTSIEYCRDPKDMFFAEIDFIGYQENIDKLNLGGQS
jgi:hypothetical protein